MDPFLVYEDADPFWASSHDIVVEFFATALGLVRRAPDRRQSVHWRKAERLLTFPEPKEFALGLAMGTPVGSGTGREFAHVMAGALGVVAGSGISQVEFVELFTLFAQGLGPDRISDILCNILKAQFIGYTQSIAKELGIQLSPIPTRHVRWSAASTRWEDGLCLLPLSPVTNAGILLTPHRFLKNIPTVTALGFWNWAETSASQILRDDLNYDLAEHLSRSERERRARELAHLRPPLALSYLQHVAEDVEHAPYNVEDDPDLLVGWHEAGRLAFDPGLAPDGDPPEADFCIWVGDLLDRFRHAVEETDLWRVLWNDALTKPRAEKIVQAVAGSVLAPYCEAADVDLSREANIGRGAVDFKFARGWKKRALTEAKLISSSHFDKGAGKQLPQYLKSERIECGYYLCVGFFNGDFEGDRLSRVTETCRVLSEQMGRPIAPVIVDARPKESASKL
ncbi:MAG: hypothetical protein ACREN2_11405 [Candidatus Dormibacteria bacterium]